MDSARSQGKVEVLLPCQTQDPARGSFMVHPLAVKKDSGSGNTKRIRNPSYNPDDPESDEKLFVFRAAHHIKHGRKGVSGHPHNEAFQFAVDPGR